MGRTDTVLPDMSQTVKVFHSCLTHMLAARAARGFVSIVSSKELFGFTHLVSVVYLTGGVLGNDHQQQLDTTCFGYLASVGHLNMK